MDFIRSQGILLRGISCISWISWDLISLGGISPFHGFSGYSSEIKAIQDNSRGFYFREFQWNWRDFQGILEYFRVIHFISWVYKGFHLEVHSGTSLSGLLGISREFKGFQGVSRDLRNFKGISRYFKKFKVQCISRYFNVFQGISR